MSITATFGLQLSVVDNDTGNKEFEFNYAGTDTSLKEIRSAHFKLTPTAGTAVPIIPTTPPGFAAITVDQVHLFVVIPDQNGLQIRWEGPNHTLPSGDGMSMRQGFPFFVWVHEDEIHQVYLENNTTGDITGRWFIGGVD